MSEPEPYTVTFTPAARRRLGKLSLSAATALYEHLGAGRPAGGHPGHDTDPGPAYGARVGHGHGSGDLGR